MVGMNTLIDEFNSQFKPFLGDTARWEAFSLIAQKLLSKNKCIYIFETGCVWTEDWKGQGCSTKLWEWICEATKGSVLSFDLNDEHVELARKFCPKAHIVSGDSIEGLLQYNSTDLDLLFLDSYDHNPPYGLSELHAIGELAVCYEKLPSGCLIAVDDCGSETSGKHNFINVFFKRMGIEPLLKSYIYVWQKP